MRVKFVVIVNKFPELSAKTRPAASRAIAKSSERAKTKAQGRAKVDTGAMQSSVSNTPGDLSAEIRSPAPYSGFLDRGTRYIPADRWFSGPVEEEAPALGATLETELRGAWS